MAGKHWRGSSRPGSGSVQGAGEGQHSVLGTIIYPCSAHMTAQEDECRGAERRETNLEKGRWLSIGADVAAKGGSVCRSILEYTQQRRDTICDSVAITDRCLSKSSLCSSLGVGVRASSSSAFVQTGIA